jgi:hypothetical protein
MEYTRPSPARPPLCPDLPPKSQVNSPTAFASLLAWPGLQICSTDHRSVRDRDDAPAAAPPLSTPKSRASSLLLAYIHAPAPTPINPHPYLATQHMRRWWITARRQPPVLSGPQRRTPLAGRCSLNTNTRTRRHLSLHSAI